MGGARKGGFGDEINLNILLNCLIIKTSHDEITKEK
jgi:hypothetical protein